MIPDPWMLLHLNPEDSVEFKVSCCIEFFEDRHSLMEHIAVLEFVACQAAESTKFKDAWRRYSPIRRIDIYSAITGLIRVKWG